MRGGGSGEIDVGRRLRELRIAAGLSQRALAKKAGVSNATISMVESNRVSPSISALRQILSGFPLGIAEFFAAPEPDTEQVVFRAHELREIAGGAVSYRQVGANLANRALQIMHERYQAGSESGRPMISHQGEEGGIVIKGHLQLDIDGHRYELGPGDAYLFDSRRPHAFRNIGEGDLVIVSACTPPSF
ncbi:MAG: cupin domain-containing protein [Ancalomicrobiaceae bacterium]|nr:cupin domain-containing protein [Ancalomicrobiaceae bacterium]